MIPRLISVSGRYCRGGNSAEASARARTTIAIGQYSTQPKLSSTVSSGGQAKKALRDGSSSLCWFWPLLITYTCTPRHTAVCRDRAEGEEAMHPASRIIVAILAVFVLWTVVRAHRRGVDYSRGYSF